MFRQGYTTRKAIDDINVQPVLGEDRSNGGDMAGEDPPA
jgi:hypothetical protein